jgi:hypothetical protein
MSLRWRRQLVVDLRPGIDGEEWDELLDAIVAELPNADRIRFLVPELTAVEQQLIATLVDVLQRRGVEVEQRRMR